MPDKQTIEIDQTFIDYLRKISNYLLDGLRDKRTNKFEVECVRKPVFVLACDQDYFDGLQGAIHTLDTYWSDHRIIFYDLGISNEQEILLRTKCARCTIIKFPFSSIEKFASHISTLKNHAFKPFVIQDALHRYGTVIYADSSIRFNSNSFNPVVIDNYIRGFAVREIPDRYLSCYTHTDTFTWFNQSYTNFDNIYIADSGLIIVTDTFITRLIMKAWLTCALEPECLITFRSQINCSRTSSNKHRYDESTIVIILSHFFFQGNKETWGDKKFNDPAPYDMFTSIQTNLGEIKRYAPEQNYLFEKKYLVYGKNLSLFNDYCDEKIKCALSNMICTENKCQCIITKTKVYFWTGKRCIECIQGWTSFSGTRCLQFFNERKTWFDAHVHCHKYNADLVDIDNWPSSTFVFVENITNSYVKSEDTLINIWATANSNLFDNDESIFTDRWFNYLSSDIVKIFCVWLIKQSKTNVTNKSNYKLPNEHNKSEICVQWIPWNVYGNYRCRIDSNTKCLLTHPFICEIS
ncbi:unnamed protein product [Rotaria sordida]|uniref:C-type lectin domain-containing protein n=1 Tax=Rotaria sordida TaxID=392033 RepID=A0A819WCG2_9BILA|nr:unnamed protein product [Rotaria sordida]